jgi:hypothetical protein
MYIVRDVERETSPAMELGSKVHKAIEDRLGKGVELPPEAAQHEGLMQPIAAFPGEKHYEWRLGMRLDGTSCDFDDEAAWGRGIIDVALLNGPIALLFDWKTGRVREDPTELQIHAVLLRAHHPELRTVTGRYVWLREGRVGQVHDLSDTVVTLARIRGQMEKFRTNMRTGDWQKRQNVLCGWCPVYDCEFNQRG